MVKQGIFFVRCFALSLTTTVSVIVHSAAHKILVLDSDIEGSTAISAGLGWCTDRNSFLFVRNSKDFCALISYVSAILFLWFDGLESFFDGERFGGGQTRQYVGNVLEGFGVEVSGIGCVESVMSLALHEDVRTYRSTFV